MTGPSTARVGERDALASGLRAWRAAERSGNTRAAAAALAGLLARLTETNRGTVLTDQRLFYLAAQLGYRLERAGDHATAVELWTWGIARAGAEAPVWTCLFRLKAAAAAVALLDFAVAARALAGVLGVDPDALLAKPEAGMAPAITLSVPGATSADRELLQTEALQALLRLAAATGRFATAVAAGEYLLARLRGITSLLRADELELLIAELHLDRGALAEAQARLARLPTRHPELQGRRDRLRGAAYELAGELGRARQRLGSSDRGQRLAVLAALNRLGEAKAVLEELRRAEPDHPHLELWAALLAARERVAPDAFGIAKTPRDLDTDTLAGPSFEEVPAMPETGIAGGAVPRLHRRHARLRIDATAWFNLGLLALHHGFLRSAMGIAAQLMMLAQGTDSGLIKASADELWSFVAYNAGDFGDARRAALEALAFYEPAGMMLRAWRIRTLLGWCMRRLGAGEGERLANARQVFALQARVAEGLEPADRARFCLNKWSIGEERLAAELAAGDSLPPLSLYRRLRRLAPRVDAGPEAARWRAEEDLSQGLVGFFARVRARRGRLDLAYQLHPHLLAADAALLHFVTLPDRVVLFVLARDLGCRRITRAISRPLLWHMVEDAITGLMSGPSRWNRSRTHLAELADSIGLNTALEMLPTGVKRLAIVPDGLLAHVPFAALPVGDRPLIARWSVELVPDPAWECRPATGLTARKPRLAVAASVTTVPNFPPLPLAEEEVREVQAAAPGRWQFLAGPDATRSAVQGALGQASAAHIVSHGEYVYDRPDRSGLVLANGWLTAAEIAGPGSGTPSLVSLAACWTANAAVLPGALSVGLPHAFLAAGARHVIGALWRVPESRQTAAFSAVLYRFLAEGAPPPVALAAAQCQEIDGSAATRIWAGMVCYASGAAPAPAWRRSLRALTALGL